MIGRYVLKFRQRFGHGLKVAWYRDVVRSRILRTAPIEANDRDHCEIHVLTSSSDWLNLVWALKSFYHASQRRYALAIHDDGTLQPSDHAALHHHFPLARIIDRKAADQQVIPHLMSYALCSKFRESNPLAPKVFDFLFFLNSNRMMLLDSDVLFFSSPSELVNRIENPRYMLNSVNGDVNSAYTVSPLEALRHCQLDLIPKFNSGLGLIHRDSLRLDWIEEFLAIPGVVGHFWRIEQTLYALSSSRFGVEMLPKEYDVFLDQPLGNRPSRHYVGVIRHLMYSQGLQILAKRLRTW